MLFAGTYLATKAALLGIAVYLICFLLWSVFRLEITRDKLHLFRMSAAILMIAALAVLYLTSPVRQHLTERLPWFHYVQVQTGATAPPATTTAPATTKPTTTPQTTIAARPTTNAKIYRIANWLLSSRLSNSRSVLFQYAESGMVQKLTGLGYTMQPSYRYNVAIAVEMDFISVLYRHGIIGLLLFSAPFFSLLACALRRALKALKGCLASLLWCTSLYQTMIAFAVGFLIGHTFVAPAVSIYAICSLLRLLAETDRIYAEHKNALPPKK